MTAANDNGQPLRASLDHAQPGQAITIAQPHRKFGRCYAEFVAHAGNGRTVMVRKLIASMHRARWTGPLPVDRRDVIAVHCHLARH